MNKLHPNAWINSCKSSRYRKCVRVWSTLVLGFLSEFNGDGIFLLVKKLRWWRRHNRSERTCDRYRTASNSISMLSRSNCWRNKFSNYNHNRGGLPDKSLNFKFSMYAFNDPQYNASLFWLDFGLFFFLALEKLSSVFSERLLFAYYCYILFGSERKSFSLLLH